MKTKIIALSLLIFSQSVLLSQGGWQVQYDTILYAYDLYFINEYTGWVVNSYDSGGILKTTNKGLNWICINTQFRDGQGIWFHDELTGWVAYSSGNLLRTSNSGYNWSISDCGGCNNADDFIDVQFVNEYTGWAYGDRYIYKTTNGGLNYLKLPCNINVFNGYFINSNTGWVGGFGGISKTTDGGLSWTNIYEQNRVRHVYFVNESTGWACSYSGLILNSENGGLNWTIQSSNNPPLFKIQFVNQHTGWIVGDSGTILNTTNNGTSWNRQLSPATGSLRGIFMLSAEEGWVCGQRYILHTTNGGGTIGIQPVSSEIPKNFSLSQNYPNPFNPAAKIRFEVPAGNVVKLAVYDLLGKEITVLVNEKVNAGIYEVDFDGSNLASGIYYYKLTAGDFTQTKKMVLIK